MNLPLDEIEAFAAVLATGSLSAAARRLRLSQPTLRARIAALESRLGLALFTRGPSGLTPTPQARDLGPRAEAVLSAGHAFERAASAAPRGVRGTVRLTAPRVFAVEVLPPILAALSETHPGLTVELAATDRIEDLARQDADIALRAAEPTQPTLVARRLRPVRIALHAAPALLSRTGLPPSPGEALAHWPWVWEDRGRAMSDVFAARGLPRPARIALATDDDAALIAAVAAGAGLGLLQAGVGAARGLTPLFPELALDLPVWLVVTEDLRHAAHIRAVLDHLAARLG